MRTSVLFNEDWRFCQGDIQVPFPPDKQMIYSQSKTERYRNGPAARAYRDIIQVNDRDTTFPTERWERICLPHDYVVMGTPTEVENNTRGYLKYDNAWYRKHFTLEPEDVGKRIVIEKKNLCIPPIFNVIANTGRIPERDMFNTFNMGTGMCAVVPAVKADAAIAMLKEMDVDARLIGEIVDGERGVDIV